MPTGYYILMGAIVIFGLLGLFANIFNMIKANRKQLLDDMFDANDIDETTYKKWSKKV
jgi:hypothetical protein